MHQWKVVWNEKGVKGLRAKHYGRPTKLPPKKEKDVRKKILEGAEAHGFPGDYWTLSRITQAVSAWTTALAWISKRGMRKEKVISILKDLKSRYEKKRFVLMWDGLPAHKAKIVQTFIKENASWLTMHRFPAYSPELNPQEFMWSAVKRKDMGNYCPNGSAQLRSKVYRSLRGRKNKSSFLRGCLKASGLLTAKELGEG